MLHTLLFSTLSLVSPARAELSPADDENGFRIYDILTPKPGSGSGGSGIQPKSGSYNPKFDGDDDGIVEVAGKRNRKDQGERTRDSQMLRGKLLVVGKDAITVNGVRWEAGSNYWFWSRNPMETGDDPCSGEPLAKMAEPSAPDSFVIRLAVDGMTKGDNASLMGADGSLPGTTCRPQHAARGPSRVFDNNKNYMMRSTLGESRGTLYRMELQSEKGRQALGYAYHDPGAPNFGDPGRFGWFLETHTSPETSRPLSQLPTPIAGASRSRYERKGDAPRGMIDLSGTEFLLFTVQTERPESVSGVNTIDLLAREK